jgi:muramoyltetrapeptide carboxypeptidase
MKNRIIPPPLQKGDPIQIIAPGGQLNSLDRFRDGLEVLTQMGFVVRYPERLWPGHGFLAASDGERADELNRAFADEETRAIMALRGGYGCLRMLNGIDLDLIRRRPKMVVGFSDITVLQNYLLATTGLLSLHGPVLNTLTSSTPPAIERLYHCLTGSWRNTVSLSGIEILRGGPPVDGTLAGGNLTSLATLLGTSYDFSWKNRVIVLEDVNEPLYRLDRMLTQLNLAGKFNEAKAILLGDFSTGGKDDSSSAACEWIWQRVLDLTDSSRIPVWVGLPFGHRADNMALPIGARVTVNNSRASLAFF